MQNFSTVAVALRLALRAQRGAHGRMEINLHKFDVLQSGATAQGGLKVGVRWKPSDQLIDHNASDARLAPAGVTARTEQTAEGRSGRLCGSGAMFIGEERRGCSSLQDAANWTKGFTCGSRQRAAHTA